MDLYQVVICLFPEDELLASSFLGLSSGLDCRHIGLPDPRAKFCCRPRRVRYRVLRRGAGETVAPRKTRDLLLPASFWARSPKELHLKAELPSDSDPESPTSSCDISEVARQIHRLADYFNPADLTRQLELICCFSDAALIEADEGGAESLFCALLRIAEYQQGLVTFVCPPGTASPPLLAQEWLRHLGGRLERPDGQWGTFWRGGLRLPTQEGMEAGTGDREERLESSFGCRVGRRVRGVQLLWQRLEGEARGPERDCIDDFSVSMASSRWLDCLQDVNPKDICPLAFSSRRWVLCLESQYCEDARRFLEQVRSLSNRGTALLCRLRLYSSAEATEEAVKSDSLESDYIPGSERWVSQLSNDLRPCDPPVPSSVSGGSFFLSLLLLPTPPPPSAPLPAALLPCVALGLRLPWELPLRALLALDAVSEAGEDEAGVEEGAGDHWERLEVVFDAAQPWDLPENRRGLREMPTRPPTASQLKGVSADDLLDLVAAAGPWTGRGGDEEGLRGTSGQAGESEGKKKVSGEGGDHLVEQILRCFNADASSALPPTKAVKAEKRPLIDRVDDPTQLQWPRSANTFYHGVDYNRGPWCEAREERLRQIQSQCIKHETMCTVTRFGCRGNVTSSAIPAASVASPADAEPSAPAPTRVPKRKAKAVAQTEPEASGKTNADAPDASDGRGAEGKSVPRSARHEQKLREVVAEVLQSNGVSESHPSYSPLSANLCKATKTMIKMQRLPNSHNLKEKMREVAQLQYQVIKQLLNI